MRKIYSLAGLLRRFGIRYQLHLGPKTDRLEVFAYHRDDRKHDPPSDIGTVYDVLEWDPLLLSKDGAIEDFLRDLDHAASCGCEGCAGRMDGTYTAWQRRKEEKPK